MEYHSLIIKFFAGEITDCELIQLKAWLESSSGNRRIFDEENELWQEASFQTKLENYKNDSAWRKISSSLGLGENNFRSVTLIRKNSFRIMIAAASIACLLAIGGISLWIVSKNSFNKIITSSTTIETKAGRKGKAYPG